MNSQAELSRREFLTCRLGDESYGVDILQVQEIREVTEVTRVPHVGALRARRREPARGDRARSSTWASCSASPSRST